MKYIIFLTSVFSANLASAQIFEENSLCQAVWDQDLLEAERLLALGSDPARPCHEDTFATPIWIAANEKNEGLLTLLLQHTRNAKEIDWDELLYRFSTYANNRFRQHLLNERKRLEAAEGLKDPTPIEKCAPRVTYLGLILCNGHAFIHSNNPSFESPIVKQYDNSTGVLYALEEPRGEYLGFYPNHDPSLEQPHFLDALREVFMNHNRLQKVSSLGENLVISAKSYYSPSRRSSSLTSLQSVLLAPLRLQLFGVQDKKINAMLADERRYYSEDSLAFCQRAYIELDATDSENLALFVADTKRKIESGEIKYSVTGMNCVDFVRQALKSVDNDTDLTAIFDGSIPISVNGENGFSVTGAWALFKEKGFVHLIQKLLAIKLAQAA